jgi:hypothetical protein
MRSRIKVAVSGAVVAFVATATLLSGGAQADTGDAVTAGQVTTADYVTYVENTGVQCPAVFLGKAGLAACGDEAVYAYGTDTGINGIGAKFGVNAESLGQGGTGVYGYGTYAVHGQSGTGWGVWGEGPDRGVYGVSDNEGVVGFSNNVGIRAESPNIALRVKGKAEFSRSGTVTISYPNKQATVTGVPVTAKSLAFATLQRFLAGRYVLAAVPNLSGTSNSFTIYLNKAPGSSSTPKSVVVAWQVIEKA